MVDASESMAAQDRLRAAKGAALGLLRHAYLRRDRVAVVVFEGEGARVVLAPTSSVDRARAGLRRVPVGGATPLAAGLWAAWRLVRGARLREPGLLATLVILTDGRANVPFAPGADVRAEVGLLATRIRADGISSVVVDAGAWGPTRPELSELSARLGCGCLRVGATGAGAIVAAVRAVR